MRQRQRSDRDREPSRFGRFVLLRMRESGYETQEELAEAAGVSQTTVSRWIYNSHRPTMDSLGRLAEALGMELGELATLAAEAWQPATPAPEPRFEDPEEQAIWSLEALTAARRIYLIEMLRAQRRIEEQTRNFTG